MLHIFSPDNIAYIANWCTILAFLGLGAYAAVHVVKNTMRGRQKVKGNNNRAAQVQSGSVDQSQSTNRNENQSVTVNVFTPGIGAPTVSSTASTGDQPPRVQDGDENA